MEKMHHLISRYFERLRHKHHPAATELNVIHLFFILQGEARSSQSCCNASSRLFISGLFDLLRP